MVKCTVCSTMEKLDKLMQPKWDTLKKHEGRRKATRIMPAYNVKKCEWYMAKDLSTRRIWHCSMLELLILFYNN
jgi:hypothetical protein